MLNPLRYFVEVARTGSIRAAAEMVHIAGSAISRQIQLMEDMAGTPLFARHARGMVLTPAGEVYLRYARTVLLESERAQADIEDLKGLRRGHLRLCAIDGIVSGPLSGVIAAFRSAYPGITLHLAAMGTQSVMQTVRDGDADVGMAFHSSPLEGVRIAQRIPDPLCAVVAPGHALAGRRRIGFAEIMGHPLALPERTFGIRKLVDAACHVHGVKPNLVLETNSIEALRGFARAGAGVTLLPLLSARRELELGAVVDIAVDEPTLTSSSTDICVREDRNLSIAISAFLAVVAAEFQAGPPARAG